MGLKDLAPRRGFRTDVAWPGSTDRRIPSVCSRLRGSKILDEIRLQLGDFGQGLGRGHRLRRTEGGLGVCRHVLHDLLVQQLRAAPRGIGNLGHDLGAVLGGCSSLSVEVLGGCEALLSHGLHVLRNSRVLEELLCLVEGLLAELLVHGRIHRLAD